MAFPPGIAGGPCHPAVSRHTTDRMQSTTRQFSLADQSAFAELSGDCNPMHLDLQVARRLLLGGVAVHGIHLVLWALDTLLASGVVSPALQSIRVHFDSPAGLDEEIALRWEVAQNQITATAGNSLGRLMRMRLHTGAGSDRPWDGPSALPPVHCQEKSLEELATEAGDLALALPASFATLFPHLHQGFSATQSAILLACTRLVGMICPGRHSIFSGLSLTFELDPAAPGKLTYAVSRADPRVRLLDIAISGAGCRGRLETFLRPGPILQPSFTALRGVIPAGSFTGQRALVIGGARGLGELTAKLLAMGGADVTITYQHGADDAAGLGADAAAAGFPLHTMHFDIASPPAVVPFRGGKITHVYYYASPRILTGQASDFVAARLARYVEYYVTGFARSVEWLRPHAVADVCVWYPSSIFVDRPPLGLAEYAMAKACGEALCMHMTKHLAPMRLVSDRLPRLATDQNQSLTDQTLADAVDVLRRILLRLA